MKDTGSTIFTPLPKVGSFVVYWTTAACACYGANYGLGLLSTEWSTVLIGVVFVQGITSWRRKEMLANKADAVADRLSEAKESEEHASNQLTRAERLLEEDREIGQWWLLDRHDQIIATAADRSLWERLEIAVWVGGPDLESAEDWLDRKRATLERRLRLWQARDIRYGTSLLDLVEQQGDVCGDPRKQEAKGMPNHGCGCWLLAMPPGTVHVDHIVPRALGGTDDPDNLQALCHSCNLIKSDKYRQQTLSV